MYVPPPLSKAVGFLMKAWFQIQQVMPEVLQPEQELKAEGPNCELHGLINFDTLPYYRFSQSLVDWASALIFSF